MRQYGVSVATIVKKYHRVINRGHIESPIKKEYNFRIENNFLPSVEIFEQLKFIYTQQNSSFKINCSFSFILKNIDTNVLRFYYAQENDQAFELPIVITNFDEIRNLVERISRVDVINHVSHSRPNTKWVVFKLCNIRYTAHKLPYTLGAGHTFPDFIRYNRYINTLDFNESSGAAENENTCLFRCLAAHTKQTIKGISKLSNEYFMQWLEFKKISKKTFTGVDLKEISQVENLFDISIFVYEIDRDKDNEQITLTPVHTSMRKVQGKKPMYLVIWESHLCYIKNMSKLKHSYKCRTCDKLFKLRCRLLAHEKTCTATQSLVFPGGYYKAKPTIFERLERIGVKVDKSQRFYKHFAVFDFESLLVKIMADEDDNTRLISLHHPISVCVSSNSPDAKGIDFVCDYDTDELVKGFLECLEKVQKSVSELYRSKFAEIFEFLDSEICDCEEILKDSNDKEKGCDSDIEDDEARESNEHEAASIAFTQKLRQENSYRKFLRFLCSDDNDDVSSDQDTREQSQSDAAPSCEYISLPEPIAADMEAPVCALYKKTLVQIFKDLLSYCDELVIIGFNSQKYDINVIKKKFIKHLNLAKTQKFIVKKNSAYACITTDKYRFIDISNFLAPGYSYDSFLKAHEVEIRKFYFPYEFMDSPDKLECTELPPYEAFYSSLKQCNVLAEEHNEYTRLMNIHKNTDKVLQIMKISEPPKTGPEKYVEVQHIWEVNNMKTFKDYLRYYNEADVSGFVIAVQKLLQYYFDLGIDLFKLCQSSPGASRILMFQYAINSSFKLMSKNQADIYTCLRRNCHGGASIIFHRAHEANVTKIRKTDNFCKRIHGYDCNSLYLFCLQQKMPTGYMISRKCETNFRIEKDERYLLMFYWLDYVAHKKDLNVIHYFNNGGKEIHIPPYRVDGFVPPHGSRKGLILEMNGCFHHGHSPSVCPITQKIKNKEWLATRQSKYEATIKRKEYLESMGYQVYFKWECQFRQSMKTDPELKAFVQQKYQYKYMRYRYQMTENEILTAVVNDDLFGCVECDIHVPQHLYSEFEEMSPIFCTTEVPFNVIGEYMQQYAKTHNISENPRKLLIGGMKAEKILLATPLLKWYIDKGLVVTKIYQIMEFENNNRCFSDLCDMITKARRDGDKHPDKKIISDSAKLLGNSCYGSSLISQAKYRNYKIIDSKPKAQKLVNSPRFVNLEELEDDLYEFEMQKKSVKITIPLQIGYFILQYAKLFMLMFFYDFITVFFKKCDYQLMSTDTDSYYIAFAHENPFALVPMELRNKLCDVWGKWFPREWCAGHETDFRNSILAGVRRDFKTCQKCAEIFKYDSRQPGLFKLEYSGNKMIGLCSKMYCIENNDQADDIKLSCKGINKHRVKDPMAVFDHVLETGEILSATNKGFVTKQNQVYTYEQMRSSFTAFYPKREVLEDTVSTKPLDLLLKPIEDRIA